MSRDPERTQGPEAGLRAAERNLDQSVQQHVGGSFNDQDSMADLWLHRRINHGGMFGEDFEGRHMTRDVVFDHAAVPLTEEALQRLGKVRAHHPWCPESGCRRRRFAFPPHDGVVDGLE